MNGIERLITALDEIDLIAGSHASLIKVGAEDIADMIWLLMYIDQKQGRQQKKDLSRADLEAQNTFSPFQESVQKRTEPPAFQQDETFRIPLETDITRQVYLRTQRLRSIQDRDVTLLRLPAASALPESLDIARALRPLMRRVPSRTRFTIDEPTTANRIAETRRGIWTPVLKAAPMRWLEIALVVDTGESMAPWWQTIDELRILLEHHGAFRDVRIWRLATNAGDQLHLYAGMSTDTQQERNPKELIDSTGRRLILVITDCVSSAWHSGKAQQLLDLWGHSNVVTIVQVFPKRLWPRTALCNTDTVQVRATALDMGNAGMTVLGEETPFNEKVGEEETSIKSSLPIPIVTLEPKSIANWASMITGAENIWTLGVIFYQNLPHMQFDAPFIEKSASSARELVRQFRAVASAVACKLLNLLSASPVSFPIIRLIQQTMLPQAQQIHVAEIFLSGLLEEIYRDETTNDPDYIEYDFLPGVREVLRETVAIPDEFQVIEAVSTFLGSRYGHWREFYALAAPSSFIKTAEHSIAKESRPFAKIVASVWRHFGGMYESRADSLDRYVDEMIAVDAQNISFLPNVLANTTSNPPLLNKQGIKRKAGMETDRKFPINTLLRAAREDLGWKQLLLADKIGTTPVNVSRWENGLAFPSPYFRQRMCDVFGKTLAELGLLQPLSPHGSRIWNMPATRNPFFTGREDLLALLLKRLSTAHMATLTQAQNQAQALYGLGGIGKTQTAAEYAFRYGDYYTHVFWIQAASRETLAADFVALAQLLGLQEPAKDEHYQTRIVTSVKRWLTANDGWLLIMDSADDLKLAQDFLPARHKGYVLFTTRAQAAGPNAASVDVEKLNLEDGTLLLLRWSKRLNADAPLEQAHAEDRAVAERIVQEMDGLPLALVQAGAFVDETECSLADYLDLYSTHRKELLARRGTLQLDYADTVATTWLLSFQEIEQQSPAAADILRLCAFLAPDAIPEELFARGATELSAYPGAEALDLYKLNEVLAMLRRYSLVRRNGNTNVLSIHRLVQAVLKESMDEQTRSVWAERTVRVVNAAFPEFEPGKGTTYQDYLPHVQECAALIKEYHLHFAEAGQLLYRAGIFLYQHGFYPQSQSLHQQALAIREQVFGPDHPAVADSLNNLGMLSRIQNDFEQAERFHQQALAIREKTLGPKHPSTAVSLINLGVLYRTQGKYERAEPPLKRAVSIHEESLGSEHPDTLITFLNLAKLYLEQRKYKQAGQLLNQVLATSERVLEPEHPLIAHNLNLLARLSFEQENYTQAERLWNRSLAMIGKTFGSEHPATAEIYDDLAVLYSAQGRYKEARSMCQSALGICEKLLGSEHPDTIAYREHLTRILSEIEAE